MRMIHNVRRRFVLAGVGLLACTTALFIASCTQVDSITGVTLSRTVTSTCLGVCRKDYNEATEAERKRHQTQDEVCRSLSSSDARNECLAAEDDLHRSILDQLKSDLQECQDNCHRQGGGSGG